MQNNQLNKVFAEGQVRESGFLSVPTWTIRTRWKQIRVRLMVQNILKQTAVLRINGK
jgi:hypothetical protein